MKTKFFTIALILLCTGLIASAQDVFMATSEDLKEFDNLISKEKAPPVPPAANGGAPVNGNGGAPTNGKRKQMGQRDRFQGHRSGGNHPAQQPGFQQPPPPAGTEPGGTGLPPRPPPPPQ